MRTIKKQIKLISLVFAHLVLFQSCKAYYKDSVTLEQAFNAQRRAKIETNSSQIIKLKSINKENNKYYGIKKVNGEFIKIPIDEISLNKIRLENKSMSKVLTIATSLGVAGLVLLVIEVVALNNFWNDFGVGDINLN